MATCNWFVNDTQSLEFTIYDSNNAYSDPKRPPNMIESGHPL